MMVCDRPTPSRYGSLRGGLSSIWIGGGPLHHSRGRMVRSFVGKVVCLSGGAFLIHRLIMIAARWERTCISWPLWRNMSSIRLDGAWEPGASSCRIECKPGASWTSVLRSNCRLGSRSSSFRLGKYFAEIFPGQAGRAPMTYFNVRLLSCPAPMLADGGRVLYLEQAFWRSPDRAYQQEWGIEQGPYECTDDEGQLGEVMQELDLLVHLGVYVPASLLYHVIKRCIECKIVGFGKRVHSLTVASGYERNRFLANHIICMYASHGRLEEATHVFSKLAAPDKFMWASIILSHVDYGSPAQAIKLYEQMRQCSVKPDNHVFVAVLKACAMTLDLAGGKRVHADALGTATELNLFVGNCLVDMYAKCGSLNEARKVFDSLAIRDVVTWNAMLGGYARRGLVKESLDLYSVMQDQGINVGNHVTILCLLNACASVGALGQGKELHANIQKIGLEGDVLVGSSLVNMYAKCGSLDDARKVFDSLPTRDVVAWTALLHGYAEHSHGKLALDCFQEMQLHGVAPNDTTFICLLMACSQEGLVNEGKQLFKAMVEKYSIPPSAQHYTCMVDLLGRSGCLQEAENILLSMPIESDVVGWTSLLSSCNSYGDIDRGRRCFERLIELEPQNASAYLLLGSMYANAGLWRDANRIEMLRKCAGACKKPARAWIEVNSKVHSFVVGEDRDDISCKLTSVNAQMEERLMEPDLSERDGALCGHAEKLALAYGLLNTPNGTALLVTKNLRMCSDCHNGTRAMSRCEKREIIVRDAYRVHHFVDGVCSCGSL